MSRREHRPIRLGAPHHALLHPLWIAALFVLVVNDHLLKGAGMLPPIVTGKLSDFAGMLVAPLLLAAIAGVRSQRGWVLAHLAVGAVFGAIQLSHGAAELWAALMGGLGFPWVITSDPTDLVALPALWLSLRVYPRAIGSARALARRSVEFALAGVGLVSSAATSSPNEPIDTFLPPFTADVYLHNDTESELVVRVRRLAPETEIDCDVVAADPAHLLSDVVFGPIESWTMPPDSNLAVIVPGSENRKCHAAAIDGDAVFAFVVFWRDGQPAPTSVAGEGLDDTGAPGWVSITGDPAGALAIDSGLPIVFRRKGGVAEPGGRCAAQDDGVRVAWDAESLPVGVHTIVGLERGIDGCVELALADAADQPAVDRTFLCMPELELPFVVGEDVAIESVQVPAGEYVRLRAMDGATPAVPAREFVLARGYTLPPLWGVDAALIESFDCELSVDGCGTVARAAHLTLAGGDGEAVELEVGDDPVVLTAAEVEVEVALAHAQHRYVVADSCAEGPRGIGEDIEIAASMRASE